MRKVFLISILLLPSLAFSRIEQIETAFYADGYWSEWEPWILPPVLLNITIRDNEVSNRREERYHPSDYNWRFIMSKRIKKNDNGWAVYSGTFEHYGNDLKKFSKAVNWISGVYETPYVILLNLTSLPIKQLLKQ